MRINRKIREKEVRLIDQYGGQVGVVDIETALKMAENVGLDLLEISAKSNPPVCKIVDYGKFCYNQTKKEKESKKSQHQIKIKDVKCKPNIDVHDLEYKINHAKEFISKGYKVRVTCMFRGREMLHTEVGRSVVQKVIDKLEGVAVPEASLKMMGRNLSVVLIPNTKK